VVRQRRIWENLGQIGSLIHGTPTIEYAIGVIRRIGIGDSKTRSQRQSDLEKHGEGRTHFKAVGRLLDILKAAEWNAFPNIPIHVNWNLATLTTQGEYYHEFDIYGYKQHSNGLISQLIVEIDGSSHEKPKQKNRDKTAEEYAAFFLPDAKFKRIDISLLLNPNVADKNILELLR
jgi:hypothetical protein